MKIGCLGAARIAPSALVYPAHVRGDVVLQAIAARDLARAQAFGERHGFAHALARYEDVIAHPGIDLIYNPLPINLHAEWTIRSLQAGKHVLCEKPFAMNSQEARAMLEAARASGKRVIEAFHYRYHPAFLTMLEWIKEGRIGAVRSIEAAFNVPIDDRGGNEIRHLPETGGGAFMDLGCYPLSWTLAIISAPLERLEAQARLTPRGVDEQMKAELTFQDGTVAQLSASMASGERFRADLKVIGDSGAIEFLNPLAPHMGARLVLNSGGVTEACPIDRMTTYAHQLFAVIAALDSGEALPTEGEAIVRQQGVLDQIYAAAGLRELRFRQ